MRLGLWMLTLGLLGSGPKKALAHGARNPKSQVFLVWLFAHLNIAGIQDGPLVPSQTRESNQSGLERAQHGSVLSSESLESFLAWKADLRAVGSIGVCSRANQVFGPGPRRA